MWSIKAKGYDNRWFCETGSSAMKQAMNIPMNNQMLSLRNRHNENNFPKMTRRKQRVFAKNGEQNKRRKHQATLLKYPVDWLATDTIALFLFLAALQLETSGPLALTLIPVQAVHRGTCMAGWVTWENLESINTIVNSARHLAVLENIPALSTALSRVKKNQARHTKHTGMASESIQQVKQ